METVDNLNKNRQVPKSKATNFVLPLLLEDGKDATLFVKQGFENCYLYDNDQIIVVYDITKDNADLDEKLKDHKLFVESKDVNDGNKIGYIFNIPEEYTDSIDLIMQGKYTQISDDLKQAILTFWGLDSSDNYLHGILYGTKSGKEYYDKELSDKQPETAENEYFPIPDSDVENFKNMYKE